MSLASRLGLSLPIIQAPMAGVSTPMLAAEVSNAGGLGSIAIGATDAVHAHTAIRELKSLTGRPFNVNAFVHAPPRRNREVEDTWLAWLKPQFDLLGASVPTSLRPLYTSLNDDPEMAAVLEETAPPVVSFHFGLPTQYVADRLRKRGCFLIATATTLREALAVEEAGLDAIVAQGIEAGGHRGVFDPDIRDEALTTHVLTRVLAQHTKLPIIAAGGIMDGAGVAAALKLGAQAVQLGTAFIGCSESAVDDVYRDALHTAQSTTVTSVVSGRPARIIENAFSKLGRAAGPKAPDYPIAYDAGKALSTAARALGVPGYGIHWAGQGASLSRFMSAKDLLHLIATEAELLPN